MTTAQQLRCPYEVLGVARDASPEQVKKAFRDLVMKWHPDRNPNIDKEEAKARCQEINAAYTILKDPHLRDTYDKYGFSALGAAQQGEGFSADDLAAMFKKVADLLVDIARKESELFHDVAGEPYAHAKVDAHRETYSVRGRAFSLWLRRRYFQKHKGSVNANCLNEALATITMFAVC